MKLKALFLFIALLISISIYQISCKKPLCAGVLEICQNKGVCQSGHCVCPADFYGLLCEKNLLEEMSGIYEYINYNSTCATGPYIGPLVNKTIQVNLNSEISPPYITLGHANLRLTRNGDLFFFEDKEQEDYQVSGSLELVEEKGSQLLSLQYKVIERGFGTGEWIVKQDCETFWKKR